MRGARTFIAVGAIALAACASAPPPPCVPGDMQREPERNSGLGPVPGPPRGLQDCASAEVPSIVGDDGLVAPAPGVMAAETVKLKLPYRKPLTLGDGLRLEFAGVLEDSRCPQGVQCVWAGRVRIELLASKPRVAPRPLELSMPGAAQVYLDYGIVLLALDPHPASGRRTAHADYVATLSLSPASAVMPGRNPAPELPRE